MKPPGATRQNSAIQFQKEKTMSDPIVIVGAARTPMGAFQGDFSSLSAMTWAARPFAPPWRARA